MNYNLRMTSSSLLNTALHIQLITLSETPAGFSASEITGYSPETVRRAAQALVQSGRLVRATVSPRRVRYFARDEQIREYVAGRARLTPRSLPTLRSKAQWSADEPARITSRTKITVAAPLPRDVYRTNTFSRY